MEKSVQSWHRCLVFCHHLINLFARASTSGGIVRPICFAALRLIMSSNFVGRHLGLPFGNHDSQIAITLGAGAL